MNQDKTKYRSNLATYQFNIGPLTYKVTEQRKDEFMITAQFMDEPVSAEPCFAKSRDEAFWKVLTWLDGERIR